MNPVVTAIAAAADAMCEALNIIENQELDVSTRYALLSTKREVLWGIR